MTPRELRIIGISLSILSLGFAIAYGGFFFYQANKKIEINNTGMPSATITPQEK